MLAVQCAWRLVEALEGRADEALARHAGDPSAQPPGLLSAWACVDYGPVWASTVGHACRHDVAFEGGAIDAAAAMAVAGGGRLRGTDRTDCRLPGRCGDVLLSRAARQRLGEKVVVRAPIAQLPAPVPPRDSGPQKQFCGPTRCLPYMISAEEMILGAIPRKVLRGSEPRAQVPVHGGTSRRPVYRLLQIRDEDESALFSFAFGLTQVARADMMSLATDSNRQQHRYAYH
jgi:hypothetical protein